MNIDLKSFSNKFYQKNCNAKVRYVKDIIKYIYEKKIYFEITTSIIPCENDSSKEVQKIVKFIQLIDENFVLHITRFFPKYKI